MKWANSRNTIECSFIFVSLQKVELLYIFYANLRLDHTPEQMESMTGINRNGKMSLLSIK